MALTAGAVIGGYRVEKVLGSGGMGTVYLAANPMLPRYDALKVLNAELSHDPEFRARFIREAQLAAALDQPNIVAVHNRGETADGQLWIAMQYVPGTDADREVQEGRMNPGRAAHIVTEVAKALDYAHRRKLIHRDVKPSNFLLTADDSGGERVLLADFGIARSGDDSGALTQSGAVVSTIAYGAPETLAGGTVDARTDVYSLGCSLYRMLTGSAPFVGTVAETATSHLMRPPPRVTDRVPTLSPAIDAVIAKAMAKDPEQRFQSAGEFAAAVAAALQPAAATPTRPWGPMQSPSHGHPGTAPHPMQPPYGYGTPPHLIPMQPKRRRRRWIAAAVTVSVLAAAVGTGVAVSRHGDRHRPNTAAPQQAAATVDVSLLDTGGYAIKPTVSPFATAGEVGDVVEAVRMAGYLVGPWQIDKELQYEPVTVPIMSPSFLFNHPNIGDDGDAELSEILKRYKAIVGIQSQRTGDGKMTAASNTYVLLNQIIRFPDENAAGAAANDIATTADSLRRRNSLTSFDTLSENRSAGTLYRAYQIGSDRVAIWALTPYKFYILSQWAVVARGEIAPYTKANLVISTTLGTQRSLIDNFTPTDPSEFSTLPTDETHFLLSRTLGSSDKYTPFIYPMTLSANAFLNYEEKPTEAAAWFRQYNVDWVSQNLATVYRTDTVDNASNLNAKFSGSYSTDPNIEGLAPPNGMPTATCLKRLDISEDSAPDVYERQSRWHFKCFDHTDRYVFTTFSNTEKDAKQQLAAQYRLLAGV